MDSKTIQMPYSKVEERQGKKGEEGEESRKGGREKEGKGGGKVRRGVVGCVLTRHSPSRTSGEVAHCSVSRGS